MLLQHKYKEKAKLSTVIIFIPHCASKNQKGRLRGEFLPQKWLEGEETCASYLGVSMTGFVWGMHIMNLEVVRDLREMEPGGSLAHSLCSCAKESCPLTSKLFVWGPSNPMTACMSYSPSSRRTMLVLLETCPMRTTAQDKRQVLDP